MNLRVIKKDIDFILNDFVSDCLIFSDFHEGKKDDKVKDLISEGLIYANDLYNKVNHPVKKVVNEKGVEKVVKMEGKELKQFYKTVGKDLYEGFDNLFLKLSKLAKK
ncbi:MAG: hypothetical protein IJS02_05325 [Bacteroidales bacterium]|nr:hypothetical protein [Bacteroidales bacterium]